MKTVELRKRLAQSNPKRSDAERVLSEAFSAAYPDDQGGKHFQEMRTRIDFDGSSEQRWFAIVDQLNRANENAVLCQLEALVDASPPEVRPRRQAMWTLVPVAALLLLGGALAVISQRQATQRRPLEDECRVPNMVLVGAGAERVCIDRDEVTVAQYAVCIARGECSDQHTVMLPDAAHLEPFDHLCNLHASPPRPRHPMNCVDMDAARTYCRARGGDLPTTDQWYLATMRGDTAGRYPWGDAPISHTRMNGCDPDCVRHQQDAAALFPASDGFDGTAPVGSFPEGDTPRGVHDMGGNVSEWVRGDAEDALIRGGNWLTSTSADVRSISAWTKDRRTRDPRIGFRCVERARQQR